MTEWLPLSFHEYSPEIIRRRAADFRKEMEGRRSVRHFSDRPVPREIIEDCLATANSAPSGANMQPWCFVVVSDPMVKRQIREAAELEEYQFYHKRAGKEWLQALSHLRTDERKPFLEIASHLIVIFSQAHGVTSDGSKVKHYYVKESVGIATGFLIAAIHHAGLVCLPYTPSRMSFLNRILGRPKHERPFMIVVAGYPADGVQVFDLHKKSLDEIAIFK